MTDSRPNPKSSVPGSTAANTVPPSPTPPRGPRWWVLLLAVVLLAAGFAVGLIWGPPASALLRDVLRSRDADQSAAQQADARASEAGADFFTCGMHPWVILPKMGLCPICHMDLVPLDPGKFAGEISIDPVVTQNIGVRISPIVSGPVVRTIRTVGTVAYDETRLRDVNIKVAGWIEKLHVDYEGARVDTGDPLLEFYSPQLYASQSEYLSAIDMRTAASDGRLPGSGLDTDRLVQDARIQLEFFDITDEQIAELEARGAPAKTMTIRSPHQGIVIAKHANEGMRVDPGMRVYQVADLSKVWVQVSMYEYQLPFIQEGQRATMSLPYIPGQTFEGKIIYIYPYLNEKTRQVSVRLEFDNAGGILKPGMFASVELRNTLARERTLAPRSSIIDTGERTVAYVSLGEGYFEPREVMLGAATDDGMVEILDGLKVGEMVVTSGQFLLDSEAKMRESLAKMLRGDLAADQKRAVASSGQSELVSLPDEAALLINSILDDAFNIGAALAGDTIDGIREPARSMAAVVDVLLKVDIPQAPHFWHEHDEIATVRGQSLEIAGAEDIASARLEFADLSVALSKLISATGVPPSYEFEVHRLHCPMYLDGQGGSTWLQRAGPVRNPYFGSVMLECFDERTAMPVTGDESAAEDEIEPSPSKPRPEGGRNPAASPEAQVVIDEIVRSYLAVQRALAVDSMDAFEELMAELRTQAERLEQLAPTEWRERAAGVREAVPAQANDIEAFRVAFRGLSTAMIELVSVAPPSTAVVPYLYHAYCPMVEGAWLQHGDEISNPYDTSMPTCGVVEDEFRSIETGGRP